MNKCSYVSAVSYAIFIEAYDDKTISFLLKIGAKKSKSSEHTLLIDYNKTLEGLAIVFKKLKNFGVAFSAGADWSPSAQFEDLRNRNLITGKYKEIAWRGPDDFFITEK